MRIVQLQPEEFQRALPLYRAAQDSFPIISAVLQNIQRGQTFCDSRDNPRAALVVSNFGFTLLVGEDQVRWFDAELARLFETKETLTPSYLLWYSPPTRWQEKFDLLGSDVVRRRERVRFEFNEAQAEWLTASTPLPDGFEMKNLSNNLIGKTQELGVEIESRFWGSATDFLTNGLGVCIIKDGEVVSLCYAAAIADGLAEVDVVTKPEFRGLGLGYRVTLQFIRECLNRGVAPAWDCFDYNVGSMRLAERLGFKGVRRYPFYSFNVPIPCQATALGFNSISGVD